MNTPWKYWVAAFALAIWWALGWLAGTWMNLAGRDLWVLRAGLAAIGLAAFLTCVWWFRGIDRDHALQMEESAAGSDEIDILLRKAHARVHAATSGKAGLGNLPAILVLGETGAAKTSIITEGGMEPQLVAGTPVQNNAPLPTRALNVWYAQPFLVIEAGGPLLPDPPRWARLVKNLAAGGASVAARSVAPTRLALLCIDCEKLTAPGMASTLGGIIDQWRSRLREASQLLGVNLPVYVLFTRADRLRFFQDYVAPLSNEEAGRVLGSTLPFPAFTLETYTDKESAVVSAAFDRIFQGLADARLDLLGRQFDSPQTPGAYEFPREFRKLRSLLTGLLVETCRPGLGRSNPLLRGFYFTGVRPQVVRVQRPEAPESAPAEAGEMNASRIFDAEIAAAAARANAAIEETRRVPQWVFLPQLFKNVLSQDSTALATSSLSVRSSLRTRSFLAAAMGILIVVMIGFLVSAIRNKQLEDKLTAAAQNAASVRIAEGQAPTLEDLVKLDALRHAIEDLAGRRPPLSMRWGLYIGDTMLPALRESYFRRFQEILYMPAQTALAQTLTTLPDAPGPGDHYEPAFDTLKAYLMTTTESARCDPEFVSRMLLNAWAAGRPFDSGRLQLAQRQFEYYARTLKTANPFPAADQRAVAHARQYLGKMSGNVRAYRLIIANAEAANPALDYGALFPGAMTTVMDQTVVKGAFTLDGWTFLQNALANPARYFSGDAWVLGEEQTAGADLAKNTEDLQQTYQQDYVEQWRGFLRGASVNHPVSLANASQELKELGGQQSPLLALLCVAGKNTSLSVPDLAKSFQAVQTLAATDCQQPASNPAAAPYLQNLRELQTCIDRVEASPAGERDSAKTRCMSVGAAAEKAVKQIAAGFSPDPQGHMDRTVKDLLLAPINDAEALLRPGPVSAAGLCAQMSSLESQFPFSPHGTLEVSLQELGTVFAPGKGAVSQFYAAALKNLLLAQGNGYASNPAAPQKVSPAFLSFFNCAAAVQRTLYPTGAEPVQFRYAIRPLATENVSSLALSIDGKNISYGGGAAQFITLNWPATSGQGVRLTVKIPGGTELGFPNYDGVWGLFHFFADATVLQHKGNIYTLQWVLGGDRPVTAPNGKPVAVELDLDTLGAAPILERGFLSNLRCVPVVAQ